MEFNFTISNLNYAVLVIPITFQFHLLIFPCQRQMYLGERLDYYKLNRVVTSISTAAPDVISLLEQINTSEHKKSSIDVVNAFFLCL